MPARKAHIARRHAGQRRCRVSIELRLLAYCRARGAPMPARGTEGRSTGCVRGPPRLRHAALLALSLRPSFCDPGPENQTSVFAETGVLFRTRTKNLVRTTRWGRTTKSGRLILKRWWAASPQVVLDGSPGAPAAPETTWAAPRTQGEPAGRLRWSSGARCRPCRRRMLATMRRR